MLITQVNPTPITKELAQASLSIILDECGYARHINEDLQTAFDGNFEDHSTRHYAQSVITEKLNELVRGHEDVIKILQESVNSLNAKRAVRGAGMVLSGQTFAALNQWSSELPHLICLRDYFLQRLEQHISNE